MKLQLILDVLSDIAPLNQAQPWDNVGLLIGDKDADISRALLTIDYTRKVSKEARDQSCNLIISYHPPLFTPIKQLTAPSLLYQATRDGIAIYSPHTALDVAEGGTNDVLAEMLGLQSREPLRPIKSDSTTVKLVTFVPEKNLETVSNAMFAAGAGRIGDYAACSFRSPGYGTFYGLPGTDPSIGKPEHFEQVSEVRMETIVSFEKLSAVLLALRGAHPYEEPAYDIVPMLNEPGERGIGWVGVLASGDLASIIQRVRRELKVNHVLLAGSGDRKITRAAVCAGSCGEFLQDAINAGAELLLTGEMRHHDAIKAAEHGVAVICTLHSNSERAVLPGYRRRIINKLPELDVILSKVDADPFEII